MHWCAVDIRWSASWMRWQPRSNRNAVSVAAVYDRRIRQLLEFKRVLWQPADKSLLDTANLRGEQLVFCALDSRPHKATSPNTILQNA